MRKKLMGLSEILSPVTTSEFLENYWDNQPLVVKRTEPGYFNSISGFQEFESALALAAANGKDVQIGKVFKNGQRVQRFLDKGEAVWPTAIAAFNNGYSVSLYAVEKRLPQMSTFFQNLEREMSSVVSGIFFASSGGEGQGFLAHYDKDDNYILQLQGSKRWRIWKPEPSWDASGKLLEEKEAERLGEPILDVYLKDGDFMYVPRGWIHHVNSTDDASLHLSLIPDARSWMDFTTEAVYQAAYAIMDNPMFRKSLPFGYMSKRSNDMKVYFESLIRELFQNINFETALKREKRKLRRNMLVRADSHFQEHVKAGSINAYSKLRVKQNLSEEIEISLSNTHALLEFVGNELELPIEAAVSIEFMLAEEGFQAIDLPLDAEIEVKVRLLQDLVRGGFLEFDHAAQ